MLKVKGLHYAPQQSSAGKNLQLRVEVGGVLTGSVQNDRVALQCAERSVVCFKVNLYAHLRLKDIGLPRHVDG